jgi:hypothetical protein
VPPRKRGPSDQARATVYQKVGELITGSRPPPPPPPVAHIQQLRAVGCEVMDAPDLRSADTDRF